MLRFGRGHHGCDDAVGPVLWKDGLKIASWGSANDRHALVLRVLRLENAEPVLVVERDGGLGPGLRQGQDVQLGVQEFVQELCFVWVRVIGPRVKSGYA